MKMRTVELTVGAFMIAGLLSLLMLALQVSDLGEIFRTKTGYRVCADFENIGGLKVRAKVSVAGVEVGRVVSITLEPHTFNAKVIMALDPQQGKLPADTRASIMTSGLLGDNYIALTPGYEEDAFLQDKANIPIENTDPAIVLEQLISKFVANQASGDSSKDLSEENTKSILPAPIPNKEKQESVDIKKNPNAKPNRQKPSNDPIIEQPKDRLQGEEK
jgi:phospholipid/cholesterol/gamma-HCH transport system substrate-binding protein